MALKTVHRVLECIYFGPKTILEITEKWGRAVPVNMREMLAELVQCGHVIEDGEIFRITEQGRSRYIIDSNCDGW